MRKYQSSAINLNLKGQNTRQSTPVTVTLNFETGTLLIETTSPQITELFEGQMAQSISETKGEMGDEFSLMLGEHVFAHFYLDDRAMIMFTRNDVHPMTWGLMLTQVSATPTR